MIKNMTDLDMEGDLTVRKTSTGTKGKLTVYNNVQMYAELHVGNDMGGGGSIYLNGDPLFKATTSAVYIAGESVPFATSSNCGLMTARQAEILERLPVNLVEELAAKVKALETELATLKARLDEPAQRV